MPVPRNRRDVLAKRGAGWDDRPDLPKVELRELDAALYRKVAEAESALSTAGNQVRVGGFVFSAKGLEIDTPPTQEEWQQAGEILFKLEGSIQWLIGDWLVYGESVQWGDVPAIAAALGREPKTLYEYTYISRSVQFSIRMENLTWTHHQQVAALSPEQQTQALAYAAENKLSVAEFRKWLKGESPKALPAEDDVFAPDLAQKRSGFAAELDGLNEATIATLRTTDRRHLARQAAWLGDYYQRLAKKLKG